MVLSFCSNSSANLVLNADVYLVRDIKNKKFIQNNDIYNTPIAVDSWGVDWNIIKPQEYQTTI
jgi:hypothetical protein